MGLFERWIMLVYIVSVGCFIGAWIRCPARWK